MTSYKDIFKAISMFGSVQGINTLLNLVRTKLIATLIGTVGTGLNSIFFETRELMHISTNLGLDTSCIRNISVHFEEWKNSTTDETRAKAWDSVKSEVCLVRSLALILAILGTFATIVFVYPLSYLTFQDNNHIFEFLWLAPSVGITTIICSETAILKAIRKLKSLALISTLNVIAGICTSIPIYYYFGLNGIIPAILFFFIAEFVIAASFSYHLIRPQIRINKDTLRKGKPILKLGIALTLAGVALRTSQLGIRSYINNEGGTDMVGLYSAGYSIVMLLGSFVFSSIEADYYPRLSGAFNNLSERKAIVYKQIKATLLLITPSVLLFVLLLPYLVPLLLSHDFDPIVPMAQVASLSLIFRAATQPYGFVPIAAGNAKLHMVLESYCDILICIAVVVGFTLHGLLGAGIGYTVANALDLIVLWVVMKWKYKV